MLHLISAKWATPPNQMAHMHACIYACMLHSPLWTCLERHASRGGKGLGSDSAAVQAHLQQLVCSRLAEGRDGLGAQDWGVQLSGNLRRAAERLGTNCSQRAAGGIASV